MSDYNRYIEGDVDVVDGVTQMVRDWFKSRSKLDLMEEFFVRKEDDIVDDLFSTGWTIEKLRDSYEQTGEIE